MKTNLTTPAALSAALAGDIKNAMVAGTPGGILRQEAEGQQQLLRSAMLPKQIEGATREQLEALGFKFGADVDDLFVHCELPAGWTKQGTDHSMNSHLLDEQGRKRAAVFYKAAFYDQRADMRLRHRFNIHPYGKSTKDGFWRYVVIDGDAIVFDGGEWASGSTGGGKEARAACEGWLDESFPDWRSPLAYW